MACSQTLSTYSIGECFSSKGGIKKIWVANYVEDGFTLTTGGTVSGFSTGVTWYGQELRKGTGSMTSTYNYDEANGSSYWQTDAVIVYSKMQKENRIQTAALAKGDLMAVVMDENGTYFALGVEEPVKATAGEGTTGSGRSDANQYSITLSDYNSTVPQILDDSAISALS